MQVLPYIHFRLILIQWCLRAPKGRLNWRDAFCRRKGVKHALDHIGDSFNFVASGIGERLHAGRICSYPPGHRRHRGTDPSHSGTKNILAIWPLAGKDEVFGKEVASSQKDFTEPYHSFSRKGLVMNHFTTNLQSGKLVKCGNGVNQRGHV